MSLLAQYQPQSLSPLQLMLPQMLCFAFQPAPLGTENLEDFEKRQSELQQLEYQLQVNNARNEELSNISKALQEGLANLGQERRDLHDKLLQLHRNATLQKQKLEEMKAQLQHNTSDPRIRLLDQILKLKEFEDQCRLVLSEISQHRDGMLEDIATKNTAVDAATQKIDSLENEFNKKEKQINAIKLQIQQLRKEIQVQMNIASAGTNRRRVYQTTTKKPSVQDQEQLLKQEIKKEVQKKSKADKEQLVSEAASTGNLTMLKVLTDLGVDVSSPDRYGVQPLDWAILNGDVEVTKVLIAAGANIRARNNDGDTPLQLAARKGFLEISELLVDAGADVNAQNDDQTSPLHEAAYYGFLDICRLLVEKGAYVNIQNIDENTPLHFAAQKGHLKIVQLLEEQGADLSIVNADGNTPLKEAQNAGMTEVADWIESQ